MLRRHLAILNVQYVVLREARDNRLRGGASFCLLVWMGGRVATFFEVDGMQRASRGGGETFVAQHSCGTHTLLGL